MAKICPAVRAEHQEALEKARRRLHALIAQQNCPSLILYLEWKFGLSSRNGHTLEMTKTNLTEHELAANARIEDIAVKMLKAIKGEFPIISHADLCQLAGLVALEMSGGPDIPFHPQSELKDSLGTQVFGGLDFPFHPETEHAGSLDVEVSGGPEIIRQESELAGSVAVEVSGGPEIPRQESELAGFVAVHMSGVSDIPFQPKIELTDSVNTKMFGGLDTVSQPERELAGCMTVEVSGEHEILRQESEVMGVAAETLVPIDEMVRSIRLETKIPRFPRGLHRIRGQDNRYIIPSVVALGPYYHGLPQLPDMEEEKRKAARYMCMRSGCSLEEVKGKILSIAPEARSCYVDTDVAHFSDKDFARMMFFDGCFLRYITENVGDVECALLENRMTLPPGLLRDIFLLENQLPWLVLEALVTSNYDSVYQFVARMAKSFDITACPETESFVNSSYKPPHLLALLRHHLIGSLPAEDFISNGIHPSLTISAIELAEIGVKVTASKKTWFADTSIQKGLLFGKLSLTPLFLNGYTACWLVNMAAFESTSYLSDGYTICSYVSLLAMLMDKVEDVHALRTQHLLHSSFSNQETLDFFKGLAHDLPRGRRYKAILREIEEYKCQRAVRIVVHKFIYNNYKTIASLFSVGGVLASIFFGFMSLKQHR